MFISKKRWNEINRRISILEKKVFPKIDYFSKIGFSSSQLSRMMDRKPLCHEEIK